MCNGRTRTGDFCEGTAVEDCKEDERKVRTQRREREERHRIKKDLERNACCEVIQLEGE